MNNNNVYVYFKNEFLFSSPFSSPCPSFLAFFASSFLFFAYRLFKQSHSPPHKYNFVNFAGE